jgi:hypothetical protein
MPQLRLGPWEVAEKVEKYIIRAVKISLMLINFT